MDCTFCDRFTYFWHLASAVICRHAQAMVHNANDSRRHHTWQADVNSSSQQYFCLQQDADRWSRFQISRSRSLSEHLLGFPEGKTHASTIPFKFLNIFFERKLTHDFPYLLLYSCKADSYACSNVSPRLRIQAVIRHLHARFWVRTPMAGWASGRDIYK